VSLCGAMGGFVNVFVGDYGLHLPKMEEGVWRPGYIGVVVIGLAAACAAWLTTQTAILTGGGGLSAPVTLRLSDLSMAIIVGFGGARWFRAEADQMVFRRAAVIAAGKAADPRAAAAIATSTPMQALAVVNRME
jgi:hypothetical protein